MARIKGILFDKDGTLVDFRATWLPRYRGAAAELAATVGGGPGLARALLERDELIGKEILDVLRRAELEALGMTVDLRETPTGHLAD